MEKPNNDDPISAWIDYCSHIEKKINGSSLLDIEISLLKSGLAHDLALIRLGEQGESNECLKYTSFDKNSPKYNMVPVLMKNIKAIEGDIKSEKPGTKETIVLNPDEPASPNNLKRKNIQDFALKA